MLCTSVGSTIAAVTIKSVVTMLLERLLLLHTVWTRRKVRRISWCLILEVEHLM